VNNKVNGQCQELQAQEPRERDLCEYCHGVGLIEKAYGGEWCWHCGGTGRAEKDVEPPIRRTNHD
jgi:DnaJ-class molecular chaperone